MNTFHSRAFAGEYHIKLYYANMADWRFYEFTPSQPHALHAFDVVAARRAMRLLRYCALSGSYGGCARFNHRSGKDGGCHR